MPERHVNNKQNTVLYAAYNNVTSWKDVVMSVAIPHRGRIKQYTVRQNPRMLKEAAGKDETV